MKNANSNIKFQVKTEEIFYQIWQRVYTDTF